MNKQIEVIRREAVWILGYLSIFFFAMFLMVLFWMVFPDFLRWYDEKVSIIMTQMAATLAVGLPGGFLSAFLLIIPIFIAVSGFAIPGFFLSKLFSLSKIKTEGEYKDNEQSQRH